MIYPLKCRKQVIYLLLFVLFFYFSIVGIQAQCHCSSSSPSLSFGENGAPSVNLLKNQWLVELQADYRTFKSLPERHVHDHYHPSSEHTENAYKLKSTLTTLVGIRYGLSERITIGLQQPYSWFITQPRTGGGIADLNVITSIELFYLETISASLLLGTECPTGKKRAFSGENNLVLGSGSFEPGAGLFISKSWGNSMIRANAYYKYGTQGYAQTNFGSVFSHNLLFAFNPWNKMPLCPEDSTETKDGKLTYTAMVSILGEWTDEQVQRNLIVQHTGGYYLLCGMGIQLGLRNWQIPFTIGFPVYQSLNGEQNNVSLRLRTGILKLF